MSRNVVCAILVAFILTVFTAGPAMAGVSVDVSADQDGINSFHLAIGEHYSIPSKQVVVVREQSIPDEELSVVFHIAEQAGVSYAQVTKLRLRGWTWMRITQHFGLTAEIFYVEVKGKPAPPYGKAWGHMKRGKREGWDKVALSDPDIVNYVNLRFMCDQYGYSPNDVIKMRSKGESFCSINSHIKKAKGKKHAKEMANQEPEASQGNGKGHKKNKK